METTIVYWGYIGIMEDKDQQKPLQDFGSVLLSLAYLWAI